MLVRQPHGLQQGCSLQADSTQPEGGKAPLLPAGWVLAASKLHPCSRSAAALSQSGMCPACCACCSLQLRPDTQLSKVRPHLMSRS